MKKVEMKMLSMSNVAQLFWGTSTWHSFRETQLRDDQMPWINSIVGAALVACVNQANADHQIRELFS